jgi:hypothetical protein
MQTNFKPMSNSWHLLRDDLDSLVLTRFLSGRITKKRFEIIKRYVKTYNHAMSAPYGISPNGYAYTCGCEYDCCGCLISTSVTMSAAKNEILLVLQSNFNY